MNTTWMRQLQYSYVAGNVGTSQVTGIRIDDKQNKMITNVINAYSLKNKII